MAMERDRFDRVYMLGIGGIGMSAVARYFLWEGRRVAGYDRTLTPLTDALADEGCTITSKADPAAIPPPFQDARRTLVVYTPAVPSNHPQLQFFQSHGFRIVKRSDVLGWLSAQYPTVGVAGTHGKTSTAAWVSYLLDRLGVPTLALVGGIMNNYGRNILLPPPGTPPRFFVVEADEYDRTFLKIRHEWAVINSVDPDHLDIYGTPEAFLDAFRQFASATGRSLAVYEAIASHFQDIEGPKLLTFGADPSADFAYQLIPDRTLRIFREGRLWFQTTMPLVGEYDARNLTAAVTVIAEMLPELPSDRLASAVPGFRGVWRRFSRIEGVPFEWIDDYAHLPAEIEAALGAMRRLYPGRKLTAVFHPHLYSRTRDFAPQFARALALADEVWLLPIYPAREEPIPGVSSQRIADHFPSDLPHEIISKEELFRRLTQSPPPVLITLGAGDVDLMIPRIVAHYSTDR